MISLDEIKSSFLVLNSYEYDVEDKKKGFLAEFYKDKNIVIVADRIWESSYYGDIITCNPIFANVSSSKEAWEFVRPYVIKFLEQSGYHNLEDKRFYNDTEWKVIEKNKEKEEKLKHFYKLFGIKKH